MERALMRLVPFFISGACMNRLQDKLNELIEIWTEAGQWSEPDLSECVQFIVLEAVESLKASIWLDPPFVRNNPRAIDLLDLDKEVADTLFMCLYYFSLRGLSADEQVRAKLAEMHRKRMEAALANK